MEDSKKIAVIGGGSWATALVKILCNNLSSVNWWMRNEGAVAHILKFRHNPNYLQSVEFYLNKINTFMGSKVLSKMAIKLCYFFVFIHSS